MKKLLILFIAIALTACENEPKDYVTLSGKIENPAEENTIRIFNRTGYEKIIELEEDGSFEDTLKVEAGNYSFQHGKQYGEIYLENDNESSFSTNYESFDEEMNFTGDAAETNNFSVKSYLLSRDYFTDNLISSGTEEDLNSAVEGYKSAYTKLKEDYPDVDSTRVATMDMNVKNTIGQLSQYVNSKIAIRKQFPKGSESPKFEDYENISGGETSLDDLKGKYVYIDIWATWCGPCKAEIPSLKKLEEQYDNSNIQFVSISVDDGRGYKGDSEAAYKGWKQMINEKDLGGIQLLAKNAWSSEFIRAYKINAIPRFLLIDPDGNIVNADAPRPSNPELVKLFEELSI